MAIAHVRAKAATERFKAQLRAQGEKLTIAELVPLPPTNGPNGAQDFLNATRRLSSLSYQLSPGSMKMLKPGRARVAWQQPALATEEATNIWPELKREIESREEGFRDLRAALAQSNLWFQVNYLPGFESSSFQHLMSLKSASQWLSAAALLHLREQQPDLALADLSALIVLPVRYRGEPLLISQMVRIAMVEIAAYATWEALQYPGWRDDQLAGLQSRWISMEFLSNSAPTLAMERACLIPVFSRSRQSLEYLGKLTDTDSALTLDGLTEKGGKLLEDPKHGLEELLDHYARRWMWKWWHSYEDELWYLQFLQKNIVVARAAETADAFVPLHTELATELARLGRPPRAFLVSRELSGAGYNIFSERQLAVETERRLVVTAIALKRFEQRQGRPPSDLIALVGDYLPAMPIDPMDGHPLRYGATRDGRFLLYSVGLDGKDDGGNPARADLTSGTPTWTVGIDWVWPQPATEDEIRGFNAKLEGKRRKAKK